MRLKVQSICPDDIVLKPDCSLLKKQCNNKVQAEKNKTTEEFEAIGRERQSCKNNEVLNEEAIGVFSPEPSIVEPESETETIEHEMGRDLTKNDEEISHNQEEFEVLKVVNTDEHSATSVKDQDSQSYEDSGQKNSPKHLEITKDCCKTTQKHTLSKQQRKKIPENK